MNVTVPQAAFAHPNRFYIGGEWVTPSSDAKITVLASSTEDPFMTVAEAQEADIDRAVTAARQAFDHGPWPRMSHIERAEYLRAIARELDARGAELAGLWVNEAGIISSLANAYAPAHGDVYRYYAGLADSFPFEERHKPKSCDVGLLVREPVGVVGAIVPWNGALHLIAWKTAPALLAGCTVVIKCSPEAPTGGYAVAEIAEKIGLPPGVINVVTADRKASERLVANPDVDKITFTGSSAVGKRIAALCGARIARYTLELGGKSPAIILDDYDVGTAAQTIALHARYLSGQVCASLTRMIVDRKRHDEFVEALAAAFEGIRVGDPFDSSTEMGPLASARQRNLVESYIAKGKLEGAKVVAGGGRPAHLDRGYYVQPTVFAGCSNNMAICRDEIFGPVISVIPADSEEQAIQIANDTPFGLNASVFTKDPTRAYQVARRIRSGTVGHNSFRRDFSIAFGGFKQSGIGREGGVEGLYPFLESKTILLETEPAHIRSAK